MTRVTEIVDNFASEGGGAARIAVQRRVEWADTDASGHQHFTAVLRWVEQAEHVLHERLGIADTTLGRCPRVHLNVDFKKRLGPGSLIDVELAVGRVGRSSVAYDFVVRLEGELAADGTVVGVYVGGGGGGARPWPDQVRHALIDGGAVIGERYTSPIVTNGGQRP